jgi:hypothetical protein
VLLPLLVEFLRVIISHGDPSRITYGAGRVDHRRGLIIVGGSIIAGDSIIAGGPNIARRITK